MRRRHLVALAATAGALVAAGATWATWAAAQGTTAGHDPEQVRAAARGILDGPAYQTPAGSYILDAISWILDHLFPDTLRTGLGTGPGVVGDLVLLALLAGVVYLLYRVVRGWRPSPKADVPEARLSVEIEERRSADEWASLAVELLAAGRYREALRARYGELVARLADDGSVATAQGRTSGEYRADVGLTRPAGAPSFAAASDRFDAVWYGGADATAADVEQVHALGLDVLRAPKPAPALVEEPV